MRGTKVRPISVDPEGWGPAGGGRQRHPEADHSPGVPCHRTRQVLQHGESKEFVCLVDQDHGAAEKVHAHRVGMPGPVPLWSRDSQAHRHLGNSPLNEAGMPDMQAGETASASRRRADGLCVEQLEYPVGLRWADVLRQWIHTDQGQLWLASRGLSSMWGQEAVLC